MPEKTVNGGEGKSPVPQGSELLQQSKKTVKKAKNEPESDSDDDSDSDEDEDDNE